MAFEVTSQGLLTQTQEELIQQISVAVQSVFGPNTNVLITSIMGQLINIVAELNAANQQTALDIWRSRDPNGAIGVALDQIASLTGSIREGASASVVNGELAFSAAGTVSNGDQIRNDDNNSLWQAIGGPYISVAGESVAATFQAVDTGPILANAGTTWSIVTVVPNLTGFTNASDDATIGQDQESDESFRRTRQAEIYSQNIGPLLAISGVVSKVSTVNGRVTNVRGYHNPSVSPADADGILFKAFNIVVKTDPPLPDPQVAGPIEPLAQDIADAIFSATGAGGESYGTDYGVVEIISVADVEGQQQGPIKFDLFKVIDIAIDVTIVLFTNNDDGPIVPSDAQDMADLIRSQIATVATANFVTIGRDARALDHQGTIDDLIRSGELSGIASAVVGVGDQAGAPAFPITTLTQAVSIRQEPDYDSGNIRIDIDGTLY